MPRKYRAVPPQYKRPDPRYNDMVAARFINALMDDGKKSTAQNVFYKAMDVIAEKVKDKEPLEVFQAALENVKPRLETKSRRVGGATYQVPVQVKPKRQLALGIKWLLNATRKKKGRPMHQRLAEELLSAYNNEGEAAKKRDETHRMAESNRAFAHLAY